MLRSLTRKCFSMGESRVARHIRPPTNEKPIYEKMKRYQVETMMIEKIIGTQSLMTEGADEMFNDKNPHNWKKVSIIQSSSSF